MIIDSSASGGQRIDFEMLGRTITFWRSDLTWVPEPQQSMTAGLSYWVPFHSVGTIIRTPYEVRSGMGAVFRPGHQRGGADELGDQAADRGARDLGDLLLGDYYPLTGYSRQDDVWVAWQFDRRTWAGDWSRPSGEAGPSSRHWNIRLTKLDPAVSYSVTDLDAPDRAVTTTGAQLMDEGLPTSVRALESALFVYQRAERADSR